VKLVKAGDKFKPFQVDCGHCRAVMEVETPKDLKRCKYSDYRESWDYLIVSCPDCGRNTQVSIAKVPTVILDTLPTSEFP
jgi:primosomal protein N'